MIPEKITKNKKFLSELISNYPIEENCHYEMNMLNDIIQALDELTEWNRFGDKPSDIGNIIDKYLSVIKELQHTISEYETANESFQKQLVRYGEENSRLKETIAIQHDTIEILQSPSVEETKLRADNERLRKIPEELRKWVEENSDWVWIENYPTISHNQNFDIIIKCNILDKLAELEGGHNDKPTGT